MDRRTKIELTNMCLVCNGNSILVQEKVVDGRPLGLVFPGGHVEQGESLRDSVIREIREETGLLIDDPKPCGFKDWIREDGTRYIVLLYRAERFSGEIAPSEEGRVFWLDRGDVDSAPLIWNMRELLRIFDSAQYSEFFFRIENGKYSGELLG